LRLHCRFWSGRSFRRGGGSGFGFRFAVAVGYLLLWRRFIFFGGHAPLGPFKFSTGPARSTGADFLFPAFCRSAPSLLAQNQTICHRGSIVLRAAFFIPETLEKPGSVSVKPLLYQRCSYVSNPNVHSHRLQVRRETTLCLHLQRLLGQKKIARSHLSPVESQPKGVSDGCSSLIFAPVPGGAAQSRRCFGVCWSRWRPSLLNSLLCKAG